MNSAVSASTFTSRSSSSASVSSTSASSSSSSSSSRSESSSSSSSAGSSLSYTDYTRWMTYYASVYAQHERELQLRELRRRLKEEQQQKQLSKQFLKQQEVLMKEREEAALQFQQRKQPQTKLVNAQFSGRDSSSSPSSPIPSVAVSAAAGLASSSSEAGMPDGSSSQKPQPLLLASEQSQQPFSPPDEGAFTVPFKLSLLTASSSPSSSVAASASSVGSSSLSLSSIPFVSASSQSATSGRLSFPSSIPDQSHSQPSSSAASSSTISSLTVDTAISPATAGISPSIVAAAGLPPLPCLPVLFQNALRTFIDQARTSTMISAVDRSWKSQLPSSGGMRAAASRSGSVSFASGTAFVQPPSYGGNWGASSTNNSPRFDSMMMPGVPPAAAASDSAAHWGFGQPAGGRSWPVASFPNSPPPDVLSNPDSARAEAAGEEEEGVGVPLGFPSLSTEVAGAAAAASSSVLRKMYGPHWRSLLAHELAEQRRAVPAPNIFMSTAPLDSSATSAPFRTDITPPPHPVAVSAPASRAPSASLHPRARRWRHGGEDFLVPWFVRRRLVRHPFHHATTQPGGFSVSSSTIDLFSTPPYLPNFLSAPTFIAEESSLAASSETGAVARYPVR